MVFLNNVSGGESTRARGWIRVERRKAVQCSQSRVDHPGFWELLEWEGCMQVVQRRSEYGVQSRGIGYYG